MKKKTYIFVALTLMATQLYAQQESNAGNWKTWFIPSGKAFRLPPPPSSKDEISEIISKQKTMKVTDYQQITYWNAGASSYRWHDMMWGLWMDGSSDGPLANMLLNVAIYDATIAAWDTKYAYNRPRPFGIDKRIKTFAIKPESPSYPCEYSVAAGAAATIIAHFYPKLADSVNRMAERVMASRIAAGVAFPSDTKAGFEMGKKIALAEIEATKNYITKKTWDGNTPEGASFWKGKYAAYPMAKFNKTVVLDSSSQFRPIPPPDFTKDMEELKNFHRTFRSNSNAFYYANDTEDVLSKKIFEYNFHLNPPRSARIYAIAAIGIYDSFTACWDAKYTYWGIRPDQFDPTYQPLLPTPPFPGYPSGHAAVGGVNSVIYSYFFPQEKAYFEKRGKDGAESRFHAGIHFRTDNEVGLQLGRKVAEAIIKKVKTDGADE